MNLTATMLQGLLKLCNEWDVLVCTKTDLHLYRATFFPFKRHSQVLPNISTKSEIRKIVFFFQNTLMIMRFGWDLFLLRYVPNLLSVS